MIKKVVISNYVEPFIRCMPSFESNNEGKVIGTYGEHKIPIELSVNLDNVTLKEDSTENVESILKGFKLTSLGLLDRPFLTYKNNDTFYIDLKEDVIATMLFGGD